MVGRDSGLHRTHDQHVRRAGGSLHPLRSRPDRNPGLGRGPTFTGAVLEVGQSCFFAGAAAAGRGYPPQQQEIQPHRGGGEAVARLPAPGVGAVRVIWERGRPHGGGIRAAGSGPGRNGPAVHLGDPAGIRRRARTTTTTTGWFRRRREGGGVALPRRRRHGGESREERNDNKGVGAAADDTEPPGGGRIPVALWVELDGGGVGAGSAHPGLAHPWRPVLGRHAYREAPPNWVHGVSEGCF